MSELKIQKDHVHLWNDLPSDERSRLMPYMIENQITIIEQQKVKAVRAHKRHMKEIDDHIKNQSRELGKLERGDL